MKRWTVGIAAAALVLGGVGQVRASLVGATVYCTWYYPDDTPKHPNEWEKVTVNPTATFNFTDHSLLQMTLSATNITITNPNGVSDYLGNAQFNGPILDIDIVDSTWITGVTLNPATNAREYTTNVYVGDGPAFDLSRVVYGSDGAGGQLMSINLATLSDPPDFCVSLDLQFGPQPPPPYPPAIFPPPPYPPPSGGTIPEPASLIVWSCLGAMGLIGFVWRRRKQAA